MDKSQSAHAACACPFCAAKPATTDPLPDGWTWIEEDPKCPAACCPDCDAGMGFDAFYADENTDRKCRTCGCTDNDCSGCIQRTGEPCHWVAQDLCSACAPEKSRFPTSP